MAVADFIADFKARFREFDETTVDQLLPVLAGVWPSYYGIGDGSEYPADQEIILNLVAHLLVLETTNGPAAVRGVVSQGTGPLSVAYAAQQALSSLQEFFGSTKYGQRFLHLTSQFRGAVFV